MKIREDDAVTKCPNCGFEPRDGRDIIWIHLAWSKTKLYKRNTYPISYLFEHEAINSIWEEMDEVREQIVSEEFILGVFR